jgi:8-amino-3,8-dideoxy-alpha-D-manno-octulosonate transaminase
LSINHAQAVSSGSAALLVGLRAMGIGRGDEVITSCFTFVATVEAIIESGATPVICEVDETLNIDPDDLERRITSRTKAIVPVHMAGAPADMGRIVDIAARHGVPVFEDAAQAFGGTYHGRALGTIADIGAFSFDFAKNITTGEGGLVVTRDACLFERARAYHDHGHEYNKSFPRGRDTRSQPGFNYRMTEVQAVVGLVQLGKLDVILESQRRNKTAIKAGIADTGLEFRRLTDAEGELGDTLIFFLPNADLASRFASKLAEKGLGTKNLPDALTWHYAGTWHHLFHGFPTLANCDRLWPVSDTLLRRAIALPVLVRMTSADIDRVISAVRDIARQL